MPASRLARSSAIIACQSVLSFACRSALALASNCWVQPVKPPRPTGEQLSVPKRPTRSIATQRSSDAWCRGSSGSDRKSVEWGKSVEVHVIFGGRRDIQNKKQKHEDNQ